MSIPMSYTPSEFPKMLYHTEHGETIVNNQQEANDFHAKGWTSSPSGKSELELLNDKRNILVAELKVIDANIKTIRDREKKEG